MNDDFTVRALQKRYARLRPNPWIYWIDLVGSAAVAWGAFLGALALEPLSIPFASILAVGALATLRATYFIHEIAHQSSRALRYFSVGWHALIGVWVLIPSFMVRAHLFHHQRATYGTDRDPEYAPLSRWSRTRFALDLLLMTLVPPALVLRWGLIGPLSWLSPPLRRLVVARMSTLDTNPAFRRAAPRGHARRVWHRQELAYSLFVWLATSAIIAGPIPLRVALQWWAMSAAALVVNQIRTYVAHTYENDGATLDAEGQVLDTLTLAGPWIEELVAPLGDRFHALHHALPSAPYHALGAIHRELMRELPADSEYRRTTTGGLVPALVGLWRRTRAADPLPEAATSNRGGRRPRLERFTDRGPSLR